MKRVAALAVVLSALIWRAWRAGRAPRLSSRGIHRPARSAREGARRGHPAAVRQHHAGQRQPLPPGQRLLLLHRQRGPERRPPDGRASGETRSCSCRRRARARSARTARTGWHSRTPPRQRGFASMQPLPMLNEVLARRRGGGGPQTLWLRLSERDEVDDSPRQQGHEPRAPLQQPVRRAALGGCLARRDASGAATRTTSSGTSRRRSTSCA